MDGDPMIQPEEYAALLTPVGGPMPRDLETLYAFRSEIVKAMRQYAEDCVRQIVLCKRCQERSKC